MGRLSGMSAVVTGGALGIGGGTARRLARDGADVLIVDVEESAANANAERIRSAGGNAVAITGDVAQEEVARGNGRTGSRRVRQARHIGTERLRGQQRPGRKRRGRIAGRLARGDGPSDRGLVPWREVRRSGHGVVRRRRPHRQHLVGPRAAHVARFSRVRGRQVGRDRHDPSDGVRFRSIGNYGQRDSPGPHRHGTQRTNVEGEGQCRGRRLFELQYPVRRTGGPDDIANAIAFLCSEEASFITGVVLPVDGGLSIQLQEDLVREMDFIRDNPTLRTISDE